MTEEREQEGRWSSVELRVHYAETDQMAVVYHANYVKWFETGRTEMLREAGLTYRMLEEQGVLLPVIDLAVHYRQPARYDDRIVVYTRIKDMSKLRLTYQYEVKRMTDQTEPSLPREQGELLVTGETSHAWLSQDWKPVRLDKRLPEAYEQLLALYKEGEE